MLLTPFLYGSMVIYTFSQTRSLALLALGFISSSSSPDTMGLRLISLTFGCFPQTHTGKLGGQVQPFAASAMPVLTIRSSKEWKVIIARRPPGFRHSTASRITFSTLPSSSLTAMRMAWKLRYAGCCFSRSAAAGMAERIMSTSSKVVSMGLSSLRLQMAAAILGA